MVKNVRAFNFRRSQPQTKILSRRIIPKLRYTARISTDKYGGTLNGPPKFAYNAFWNFPNFLPIMCFLDIDYAV